MKKMIVLAAFAMISVAAYADDNAPAAQPGNAPMGGQFQKGDHGGPGGFMNKLTDDQKTCLTNQGCQKPTMTPGQKPDDASMATYRDCMKAAFTTCNIQMPDMPMGKGGPNGTGGGDRGGRDVGPRGDGGQDAH